MLASLKRQLAQIKVRVWRSSDNHHVDRGILDHLIRRPEGLDTGVILLRVIIRLGCTLHHGVELQLGDLLDERDVEDLCAEAIADNADVVCFGGHCDSLMGWEIENSRTGDHCLLIAVMADAGEGPGDGNIWLRRGSSNCRSFGLPIGQVDIRLAMDILPEMLDNHVAFSY